MRENGCRQLTFERAGVAFDNDFLPERTVLAQRAPGLAHGGGTSKPVDKRQLLQDFRKKQAVYRIEPPCADTFISRLHRLGRREGLCTFGLHREKDEQEYICRSKGNARSKVTSGSIAMMSAAGMMPFVTFEARRVSEEIRPT